MFRKKAIELGIPGGLALGLLISILITLASIAVVSWLVIKGAIGEGSANIGVLAIQLLSALAGSAVSTGCIKRMRLQISIISGIIYYLFLLGIQALFFSGEYGNPAVTALVILIGCAIVAFVPYGNKRAGKRRIRKYL